MGYESMGKKKKGKIYSSSIDRTAGKEGKNHKVESERVIIYQNGKGVVINSIELDPSQTTTFVELPSSCIYGSLFVRGQNGDEIKSYRVVKNVEESDNFNKVQTLSDLAKYNIGKVMKFRSFISQNEERIGEVVHVSNEFILIKTDNGTETISAKYLLGVSLVDGEMTFCERIRNEVDRLKIDYDIEKESTATMQYMTSNIVWIPTYKLHLKESNVGELSLQICLCNDSESLVAKELICAIHAPNMKYMNDEEILLNRDAKVTRVLTMVKNAGRYNSTNTNLKGAEGEFTKGSMQYTLNDISLPKNSKMTVPVLTKQVQYHRVYHCEISRNEEIQLIQEAVQIINTSDTPFASGSLFISDVTSDFVGQNKLPFVAPKGEVLIDTHEAHGILVTFKQSKLSETEVLKHSNKYRELHHKGTILVKNILNQDITILINLDIDRAIMKKQESDSSLSPTIRVTQDIYNELQSFNQCSWNIQVKAGESQTLNVEWLTYQIIRKAKKKGRHYPEYYGEEEWMGEEE